MRNTLFELYRRGSKLIKIGATLCLITIIMLFLLIHCPTINRPPYSICYRFKGIINNKIHIDMQCANHYIIDRLYLIDVSVLAQMPNLYDDNILRYCYDDKFSINGEIARVVLTAQCSEVKDSTECKLIIDSGNEWVETGTISKDNITLYRNNELIVVARITNSVYKYIFIIPGDIWNVRYWEPEETAPHHF